MHYQNSSPSELMTPRLLRMLHESLLEVRLLCRSGKCQQAGDLADVFHNLPSLLMSKELRLSRLRGNLLDYQVQYYGDAKPLFDYVTTLDEAIETA